MKSFLLSVIFCFVSAVVFAAISPHEFQSVDPLSIKSELQKGEQVLLIDVRGASDFELGHIRGAILADNQRMDKQLPGDKNQLIVIYDDGGHSMRADNIALRLKNLGYNKIKILDGGLRGWMSKRLPMTSG